ncbi:uncharacterized protein BDZ99DRAFT_552433, partial [Mytilinidion resinicola]
PAKAIGLIRDPEIEPVNLLDLVGYKTQVPYCMDLRAYSILHDVKENNQSGKAMDSCNDLSSSTAFTILSKAGAWSMPHQDYHGVLTTIRVECGKKLWIAWPALNKTETISWNQRGELVSDPFAILLQEGDMLVQPPGIVHAPYTLTLTMLSGTIHWDSRAMVKVLKQSIEEFRYPDTTNEDPAMTFRKLVRIRILWMSGNPYYPWPEEKKKESFDNLFKVCGISIV